jgi:hypothetical protein
LFSLIGGKDKTVTKQSGSLKKDDPIAANKAASASKKVRYAERVPHTTKQPAKAC